MSETNNGGAAVADAPATVADDPTKVRIPVRAPGGGWEVRDVPVEAARVLSEPMDPQRGYDPLDIGAEYGEGDHAHFHHFWANTRPDVPKPDNWRDYEAVQRPANDLFPVKEGVVTNGDLRLYRIPRYLHDRAEARRQEERDRVYGEPGGSPTADDLAGIQTYGDGLYVDDDHEEADPGRFGPTRGRAAVGADSQRQALLADRSRGRRTFGGFGGPYGPFRNQDGGRSAVQE